MDDRMYSRLESQLAEAHSTSYALRERLGDVEQRERAADAKLNEATVLNRQLEKASAKQKQAEAVATTATRKRDATEKEASKLRVENEELRAQLERAQADVDALSDLNAKIERAKHVGDLIA